MDGLERPELCTRVQGVRWARETVLRGQWLTAPFMFLLDMAPRRVQSISAMFRYLDGWVIAGFLLAICSFFFCLVYAFIKWNKGFEEKQGDYKAEIQWEREEIELIERLP
jgi:hypothetical protein